MKLTRKLRRCIERSCGGGWNNQDKVLAVLCFIAIAMYIYLQKAKNQINQPGVKVAYDASGMDSEEKGAYCGIKCDVGQKSFYVKTGEANKVGPMICYDGKVIVGPGKIEGNRGINMLVIDDVKMTVTEIQNFDTYEDDSEFQNFMKKVQKGAIIIIVSYDEISERLSKESRQWINLMGSSLIENVGFRDAFILVGQLGLEEKHAIEFHRKRERGGYSKPIEKKGCFSLPFGPLRDFAQPKVTELPRVIEKLENCGLKSACEGESFSLMVDTGEGDNRKPSICINGEIVMSGLSKNSGRGFNVAVLDPKKKKVLTTAVYDTYEKDSSSMEAFLQNTLEGEIIIALVSDDGQRKLGTRARELFNQLGSSMIQNLKFRDVWYFVGRKGINGFTSTEQISYAGYDGSWPGVLKESFCLPYNFEGTNVPPSPRFKRNDARREFCKNNDGYERICESSVIDDNLKPAELADKSQANADIYRVPILIIPGINHNAAVRTLETTLMQPGIDPKMVLVAHDENFPEYADLSTLFGFQNVSLKSSTAYEDIFRKALEAGWIHFSQSKHMIVIEEELILAPDFLYFMQQCLSILDKDPSLLAVSAWNYNGYDVTSGDKNAVYRVEEFPGLAFLIQWSVYEKYIAQNFLNCCHKRVWDHWTLTDSTNIPGDIVIPDVSRVFHHPYQSAKDEDQHLVELFQKPRLTNTEDQVSMKDVDQLDASQYDMLLQKMIVNSTEFPLEKLQHCIADPVSKISVSDGPRVNYVIYYHQNSSADYSILQKVSHCFGLYWFPGYHPRNQYRGVIRFFYDGRNVLLVGSTSKFYQYKKESHYILTALNVS